MKWISVLVVLCLTALVVAEPPRATTRTTARPTSRPASQPTTRAFTVQASREGLIGEKTATGLRIKKGDIFVALPDPSVLRRVVYVEYQGKVIRCRVLDVGPWNISDPYWTRTDGPAAARGERVGEMKKYGPPTNKAGIDLSDGLWDQLGASREEGLITVRWWFE